MSPIPSGGPAAALAPEWKHELSERFEQFQHKRARQRGLFDEPVAEEKSEEVPRPNPADKVLAFEDIAPERIEPLIVERPVDPTPPSRSREQAVLPKVQPPRRSVPLPPPRPAPLEPPPREDAFPRDILCPNPVAALPLRAMAGALDLAVGAVAAGVFWTTFHLMGGAFHFNEKAVSGMALATGVLLGFYFFLYTFCGPETPGLVWMRLTILDYDGSPPRIGQRLVRAVGLLLSAAALGFGFLWALVDEEALTWHDRMSKTFVTRRQHHSDS
ncbi:MAG: RDD family protein [Acidobacteria bacterium]|nr:RDD family protein [Acidobacteriota bacterium]